MHVHLCILDVDLLTHTCHDTYNYNSTECYMTPCNDIDQ